MTDVEKASYGLRCMCYGDVECNECPYAKDGSGWHDCKSNCAKETLGLLKIQQLDIEALKNTIQGMVEGQCIIAGNKKSQIVRCRDCVHYHKGFNCDLLQKPILKSDDWFCADGERKPQK